LEVAFSAVIALVALLIALRGFPRWAMWCKERFVRLSAHRGASVAAVIITALALRLLLLIWVPVPMPQIQDEYSYLLGADTFAHGRVTNPPPPAPVYFENLHINVLPTYQSMYPPAQSLLLAVGERLFHLPWAGALLEVALMCGAITWMLQGWISPSWALLGGMACILRFGLFSYFVNSYWGGAVAAIGGAMVYGALGRLRRSQRLSMGAVFGAGLFLLANSRPYEGLLVSGVAMAQLGLWAVRRPSLLRPLAIALAVFFAMLPAMLFYNWRSTGHALLMPYQLNWQQYHITRMFFWQSPQPVPDYRHSLMRKSYVYWEMPGYLNSRSWGGLQFEWMKKLAVYYEFFLFPFTFLAAFGLLRVLLSPKLRVHGIAVLVVAVGVLVLSWPAMAHYVSPVISCALLVLLYAMRWLRSLRHRALPDLGNGLIAGTLLVLVGLTAFSTGNMIINPYGFDGRHYPLAPVERARIENVLRAKGGKHLVLVHYRLDHNPDENWSYNSADLRSQKVIWAIDMGAANDGDLLKQFPHRKVWVVDPDEGLIPGLAPPLHPYEDVAPRLTSADNVLYTHAIETKGF